MAEQIKLPNQTFGASDDIRELDDEVGCDCQLFSEKYQLPCKDLRPHGIINNLLATYEYTN